MCCAQVGCPRPADAWPLTTMLMVGYMAMQRWMWLSRRCVARWRSWFLDRANLSSSDTQPRSLHRHIPSSSDSNMPMHAVQMFEWRSFKGPFQISFTFFYLRHLPLGLNLWLCCYDKELLCKKELSCVVRCRYCHSIIGTQGWATMWMAKLWPLAVHVAFRWRRFRNFPSRVVRFDSFLLLVTLSPSLFTLTRALYYWWMPYRGSKFCDREIERLWA